MPEVLNVSDAQSVAMPMTAAQRLRGAGPPHRRPMQPSWAALAWWPGNRMVGRWTGICCWWLLDCGRLSPWPVSACCTNPKSSRSSTSSRHSLGASNAVAWEAACATALTRSAADAEPW